MREVRRSADALVGMLPYDPKYKKSNTLLSANESPFNVPDEVLEAVIERMRMLDFNRYPDPLANALRVAIAEWHGLKAANVLVGNGGDELSLRHLCRLGRPGPCALTFPPTFSVYETNAVLTNTQVVNLPRSQDDWSIDVDRACERLAKGDIDIVVITNPNNPTGTLRRSRTFVAFWTRVMRSCSWTRHTASMRMRARPSCSTSTRTCSSCILSRRRTAVRVSAWGISSATRA